MRVLERNTNDGVNPTILIKFGSLYLTRLKNRPLGLRPRALFLARVALGAVVQVALRPHYVIYSDDEERT